VDQHDNAYSQMLEKMRSGEITEPERQVSGEPLPRFNYYHLKVAGPMKAQYSKSGTGSVQPGSITVINGPSGTVGRRVSGRQDIYIVPGALKSPDMGKTYRPKTAEEMEKSAAFIGGVALKVRDKFELPNLPQAPGGKPTAEQLQAWAAGMDGKEFVAEVRLKGAFNELQWLSAAKTDDPPSKSYRGSATTALEEALEKIAAFDAKAGANGHAGAPRVKAGDLD